MTAGFLLRWFALWLGLGVLLRMGMLTFYPTDATAPGMTGFLVGTLHDVMTFALAPALLSVFIVIHRRLAEFGFYFTNAVILLVLVAEGFFWLEFESRLDRLVFHYLAYPREVIVFLEDQFLLSVFAVPFLLVVGLVSWFVGYPDRDRVHRRQALGFVVLGLVLVLSLRPLNFATLQHSRIASQFASNGYLGVLGDANYDIELPPWLVADKPSHRQDPTAGRDKFAASNKRHVVLVIEESFSGHVWRDPELRARYLPNFTQLSRQGLSFNNIFATGTRTTRGMEAILNGFPPLPGISTTERQGHQRLPSLAKALGAAGFHTAFLYGGWPEFSNFSNYWKGAGFQQIWSRDDFSEEFETSWGVADGALFARILTEMDQMTRTHERVFLGTLTVSHHRPYDFPEDVVPWDSSARNSAYAMAYADQALADFLQAAEKRSWYADTVFVIVADHGLKPQGDQLIPYESYRVPLLILSDGFTPRTYEHIGSNMSLPLTVLDLLELPGNQSFWGRSLLCDCPTSVPMEYGYHVGLLTEDALRLVTRRGNHLTWPRAGGEEGASQQGVRQDTNDHVADYFSRAHHWFYNDE